MYVRRVRVWIRVVNMPMHVCVVWDTHMRMQMCVFVRMRYDSTCMRVWITCMLMLASLYVFVFSYMPVYNYSTCMHVWMIIYMLLLVCSCLCCMHVLECIQDTIQAIWFQQLYVCMYVCM